MSEGKSKTYPPHQSPLHYALICDHYKRSCERKFRYQNAEAAEIDVRDLQAKGEIEIAVYHCRYCGEFHVGHKLHSKYKREKENANAG